MRACEAENSRSREYCRRIVVRLDGIRTMGSRAVLGPCRPPGLSRWSARSHQAQSDLAVGVRRALSIARQHCLSIQG